MSNVVQLNKPQGFTRMDNDLYAALIGADLSGRELRVALAIHRLTVGYNVEEARIAASVIAEMSGIHREDVSRAICELIRQRVVYRTGGSRSPMGFAPVSEWAIDQKNTHPSKSKAVPQCGVPTTSIVAFPPHNKDSKDNLTPSDFVAAVATTPVEVVAVAPEQPSLIADESVIEGELVDQGEKSESIPFAKIQSIYNRVTQGIFKKCLSLSDKRKRNIRKCWNMKLNGHYPFRRSEFWEGYFTDCLEDAHWRGENDRNWRAHLEFLTREENVLRVLEGE
ncbi:hypothetical protein D9M70_375530 [compost metagenome]